MKRIAALIFLATVLGAPAAQLPSAQRLDGKEVIKAFAEAQQAADQVKVEVWDDDGKVLCLGTLISGEGIVLTKASEIRGAEDLRVVMFQQRKRSRKPVRVIAIDSKTDLAILKTDIRFSPELEWGSTKELKLGYWLVAGVSGKSNDPTIRPGVMSARTRAIPKIGGAIGVSLETGSEKIGGVPIRSIMEKSPAEKAGLKAKDIVLSIDGNKFTDTQKMIAFVKKHDAGETLKFKVKRGDEEKIIPVTLGHRTALIENQSRNQKMSGRTSARRGNFERVIQHSISIGASDAGGPLLDLAGRIIGINIARVNRAEFFAIPVEDVQRVLKDNAKKIDAAAQPDTN